MNVSRKDGRMLIEMDFGDLQNLRASLADGADALESKAIYVKSAKLTTSNHFREIAEAARRVSDALEEAVRVWGGSPSENEVP